MSKSLNLWSQFPIPKMTHRYELELEASVSTVPGTAEQITFNKFCGAFCRWRQPGLCGGGRAEVE